MHISLTIFRLVTSRSAYSALPDFSTCPSLFSSAFESWAMEPLTVTVWPTCCSNLTLVPQILPSSPVIVPVTPTNGRRKTANGSMNLFEAEAEENHSR